MDDHVSLFTKESTYIGATTKSSCDHIAWVASRIKSIIGIQHFEKFKRKRRMCLQPLAKWMWRKTHSLTPTHEHKLDSLMHKWERKIPMEGWTIPIMPPIPSTLCGMTSKYTPIGIMHFLKLWGAQSPHM